MMESKRSKKSRSDAGPPKSANPVRSSLISSTSSRPAHKERVKSAPLIPQHQLPLAARSETPIKRETQSIESESGSLDLPLSPVNRTTAGLAKAAEVQTQTQGTDNINEVVIAVLGVEAVGKSTFVHLALDLKKATTSIISSKKVSLEGSISMVRLVKVKIDDVAIEAESVQWPGKIGEDKIPPIDGALVMYNVLDQCSITTLPPILSKSSVFWCAGCPY